MLRLRRKVSSVRMIFLSGSIENSSASMVRLHQVKSKQSAERVFVVGSPNGPRVS